jgi:hypothetical protein
MESAVIGGVQLGEDVTEVLEKIPARLKGKHPARTAAG